MSFSIFRNLINRSRPFPGAVDQRRIADALPLLAAIAYPFILALFHLAVGPPGASLSPARGIVAILLFTAMLAVPLIALISLGWYRPMAVTGYRVRMRRLSYACVTAPTLFVMVGVIQTMAASPIPDEVVWLLIWASAGAWALRGSTIETQQTAPGLSARWRVAHGIAGACVLLFVAFHLSNHLFSLKSPSAHTAVMAMGRLAYRSSAVEPILVALMFFQVVSGLRQTWRLSSEPTDFPRTLQIASGVYLSVFILGHMNSVFLYARTYLGIDTGWVFATGAPTGLIHDAWNIRLLPHYALGVFFVLAHLCSGLRQVLLAHDAFRQAVDRGWALGLVLSALVSGSIMAGMCGVRL